MMTRKKVRMRKKNLVRRMAVTAVTPMMIKMELVWTVWLKARGSSARTTPTPTPITQRPEFSHGTCSTLPSLFGILMPKGERLFY